MNERYHNLGVGTVWLRYEGVNGDGYDGGEFRRRLSQIEAGAAELNLDAGAVHLAAEITAFEPHLDDEQRLALILLVTASLAALQQGSTCLPVTGEQARTAMSPMLASLCGEAFPGGPDAILDTIARLLEAGLAAHVIGRGPDDYRPLIYVPPFIYHHRVRVAELSLAQLLAHRLTRKPAQQTDLQLMEGALEDTIGRRPAGAKLLLSSEQRDAVANAASNSLALISGGPGTGKTSIILAMLRVLVRMGIDSQRIALAAPTGKAAFRMGESIEEGLARMENPSDADRLLKDNLPLPLTIHRLLGFSPGRGRFTYHRNNPLQAAAVIVDEGSMLDLSLMEHLVSALQPDARLILLGDADQLPSVAAGAVFRDVAGAAAQAGARHEMYRGVCTRLTHSYRMDTGDPSGRAVLSAAASINSANQDMARGAGAGDGFARRARPEELGFTGVEFLASPGQIEAFLKRWYAARIKDAEIEKLCAHPFSENENGFDDESRAGLEQIFNHMAASRILCFTRVLSAGSERVNAALHRRRAETLNAAPEREFLPGEPVIVVRNDYERNLFNGDQGVIVRIRRPGSRPAPMAVFKRRTAFAAFHLAALRESLELSYATTIHKAQGSEFDAVAIILPERDLPLLTREALYTAVTRSRRSVAIVGNEDLLRTGIARGIERFSGLAEEIIKSLFRQP
jgi:exodeoxyribonuclease V alpha subunit